MRKLSGLSHKFMYVYFVIIGLFHLYTSVFGAYESYLQKNIHLGLVLPTAFFLFPMFKKAPMDRVPVYDWVLGAFLRSPRSTSSLTMMTSLCVSSRSTR